MAATKSNVRRDSKQMAAVPARTASNVRLRSPLHRDEGLEDGAAPPSTLPPAPFANEEDVRGLEWWLDAHMALASQLTWLEQVLESGGPTAGTSTVRLLVTQAEAVRDALYELYCDAADPRLSSLVEPGAALERHVAGSYAWCSQVVDLLGQLAGGLRTAAGVDWSTIKSGFRAASATYVPPSDGLRESVRALALDTRNPVEPLRHLPRDLEALFAAAQELHAALAPRFA